MPRKDPNVLKATRLELADVPTPIGTFRVVYEGGRLHLVDLLERGVEQSRLPEGTVRRRPPFPAGSPPRQISEYFHGDRRAFDLVIEPFGGTTFDLKVWTTLRQVPAGRTITYGELAKRSGYPGAARAVGGAMHRNPVPIVIPCHRVVGAEGSLTGFGLGLWRKRWLLDREGAWPIRSRSADGPKGSAHQKTLDSDG
ncbi:MAG TPA: methylated-DNA--[protein]-cysteine S-methyltransferase [Thermoplasmata archaeon]|nr:methylated-DNA--[protein]-cysteine S-methyltransferase [Thermoplasmata archaeon]